MVAALMMASPNPGGAATAGDAHDQPYLSTIVNQALETERTNVEISWSNPETGNRGVLVIERTWYRDPQSPCRDYRWTLERRGRPSETIGGTGCRIGPAVWRLDERTIPSALHAPDPVTPLPVPGGAPVVADPAAVPPSSPPPTTAPAPPPQTAPVTAATPSVRAERARKPPAPSAKASSPSAGDATASRPPSLPTYTLPSKTAM